MSISYLKMPDTVVLDEASYTNTFGKFSLEPLERGYGVTKDTSDNIYVTGYTMGSLDGNTNSGENDIFLVKYDSSGTQQ